MAGVATTTPERIARLLVRIALAGVVALAAGVRPAAADGLTGYLEYLYTHRENTTEVVPSPPVESTGTTLVQRYSLVLDQRLWPNLRLFAGGFFERDDETLEQLGASADTTFRRFRPYVRFQLRTPLHLAEVAWDRNAVRQISGGTSSATVRETYSAVAGVFPDTLPTAKLELFRTRTYDLGRSLVDLTENRAQLTSEYRPVKPVYLYYRGTLLRQDDAIQDTDIRNDIHFGRAVYSDTLWDRRITINSDYSVTYRATSTEVGRGGEVSTQIFPIAGLSSLDDTPEDGALSANPALIDENRTAGAGVNLGLPPIGGDSRPRNLGLDLGTPTQLDAIDVWVDRELPTSIADVFAWQVWISNDGLTWVIQQTVTAAPFGPFENRFEVRFAAVTTRFVKLVTSPLSPAVPSASDWPDIQVTELEAFLRVPAGTGSQETSSTTHRYALDLRTRLLEHPSLFYELTYLLNARNGSPSLYTVSNGLSIAHPFNPVYSTSARVAREDGREAAGDRVAYLYSASLAVVPLETLRYNVLFSGRDEEIAGRRNTNNAVYLYTLAQLYTGLDANVGVGRAAILEESGREIRSTQSNVSLSVVPHRALTLNLIWQGKTDEPLNSSDPVQFTRAGEANLSFSPIRTLYLYGSHRIESRSGQPRRNIDSYALSWLPFPDGTLRFNFSYNETLRSEFDTRETTITPSLRWDITPRWYLDLAYQQLITESLLGKSQDDIVSSSMRFSF